MDENVDFVCVTPDDPLALGCVDALEKEGIAAFGPSAYAAQMESSNISEYRQSEPAALCVDQ